MKNKILSMILCISMLVSMFSGISLAHVPEGYEVLSYSPVSCFYPNL